MNAGILSHGRAGESMFAFSASAERHGEEPPDSRRDDRRYFEFVLDSVDRVQIYAGRLYGAFAIDQMAQDAAIWRLRVIADWVRNYVSDEEKSRNAGIPWDRIAEIGKPSVFTCDDEDIHLIWLLAREHLEPLRRILRRQLSRTLPTAKPRKP